MIPADFRRHRRRSLQLGKEGGGKGFNPLPKCCILHHSVGGDLLNDSNTTNLVC